MDISVTDLKKKLKSKDILLLDVRELGEVVNGTIEGSMNIPMREIPSNLDKLDKSKEIVVYCRSGARSSYVSKFLAGQGYSVKSLKGGYLEWDKVNRK